MKFTRNFDMLDDKLHFDNKDHYFAVVEFHIIACIDYYTLYFNMFIDEIAFPLRI